MDVYAKLWGAVASQISITMPQTLRLGAFLESLSWRQYKSVERLQKLCADVASDRTWSEKGLHTTNLCVAYLEAQDLEKLPE